MWALHIAITSRVLVYKSEDNGVTYTDRFVLVRSTHTVKFIFVEPPLLAYAHIACKHACMARDVCHNSVGWAALTRRLG